jgi:hypothetical protein
MTRAVRFTSADLTRAMRAAEKAGYCVAGYEIKPDGSIKVTIAPPGGIPANDINPLDRLHHG